MQPSTYIRQMLSGKIIAVPAYQRAYSWETPTNMSSRKTHTDVFLSDLEEYRKSMADSPYYVGHFMFEEKGDSLFNVIDGQQRLTTIVIFLSALFGRLQTLRKLSESENECYEDMVKRNSSYRFRTVDYDDQFFKDYVIDKVQINNNALETESAKRIAHAYDSFVKRLADKDEPYLSKMLEIIGKASCTTHIVKKESEAIQMFIFQNNRGKKPSDLEVIKAQFMYNVHLHGGEGKVALLDEVKNRFEKIYKSISSIESKIDEDDVLIYTLRVYFNSLWESNAQEKINKELSTGNAITFIKEFTHALAISFDNLNTFIRKDEPNNHAIHSLATLGEISIAYPFIIKAYKFGLDINKIGELCISLESLILRHRLIGTRADITSRINDEFKGFTHKNPSIQPIINRIDMLKNATDWWWAHWNNAELEKAIQGGLNHSVAKFLLWKYENYLEKILHKSGYNPIRFNDIECPELEHIAPSTEPKLTPHGYDKYDDVFVKQYLDCLGNYLLASKSHNCSVGNIPFPEKLKSYTVLEQHKEIQGLVLKHGTNGTWDRGVIQVRKAKIVDFIMKNF